MNPRRSRSLDGQIFLRAVVVSERVRVGGIVRFVNAAAGWVAGQGLIGNIPNEDDMTFNVGSNTQKVDPQEVQDFAQKAFRDILGCVNVYACVLGDRLGLFKDLAQNGPATSFELAARSGIAERYAREWLNQMACAEYLKYNPADKRFSLPPSHATVLAQEGEPSFLGGFYQSVKGMEDSIFSKLLQAFREGGGVSYAEYNSDFWDGQERFTIANLKHKLVQEYIPAMPDVQAALERGALVADLGCGRGGVILMLAQAFPRSHFVGYDAFAPSIEQAQANVVTSGVENQVRYICQDMSQGLREKYDVIFCFDSLHHATNIPKLLRDIRAALKPGGIFVCVEGMCTDTLEDNIGPGGANFVRKQCFCLCATSFVGRK